MLRRLLFLLSALLVGMPAALSGAWAAAGADSVPATLGGPTPSRTRWTKVDVAPTWTSIYIGTVSMSMPTFARRGETYQAAYVAKVFPYFFYNEKGTLTVDVTDEQLTTLMGGKPIEFTGTAVRTDGAKRKVTGKATPQDATGGKLDVHVFVSKRIQLIFHTTYRFGT